MNMRCLAFLLGLAVTVSATGCAANKVLPPDARSVKLVIPNLFGG